MADAGGVWSKGGKFITKKKNPGAYKTIKANEAKAAAEKAVAKAAKVVQEKAAPQAANSSVRFSSDEQTFMNVVENSMGRKTFAYVPDVRDKLGWSKEKTDNMFRNLRDRGVIQPMTASLEDMTDAQAKNFLKNSFMDEGLGKRRTAVKLTPKERWS